METSRQLEILRNTPRIPEFSSKLRSALSATDVDILQINVGRRCNLACRHCHVQAGPERVETMGRPVLERCLAILSASPIGTIDVTGGAPEMNPHLEWFLGEAAKLGRRLMVRSNLVILVDQAYARFLDVYAAHDVEVVGSLPDLSPDRVARQRGQDTFARLIEVLRLLNARGYGRPGSGLVLDLVHNPVGAFIPGAQAALESEYRRRLGADHGVVFNALFCLTNCPVGRYLEYLVGSGNYDEYMADLHGAFNPAAAAGAMCTTTVSVGWDGTLYDCDFNQMLDLAVDHGAPNHIDRFDLARLASRQIVVGNHCYACTAGAGSSCQGAVA